ncbi:unnamed protein product [Brachionus calyciflorus]|uniref:MULE transposase domain-containing protein n=1 Tax=Brachionus calyciflorus TaxID=104777 RepID=A0A813MBT7_9BILA|nr:unnamed protein product [Brachionus calyciflorus]
MIPCVFILMNRRRTCDYNFILEAIIKEATKLGLVLDPKKIMTELEFAAINAFKAKFPHAQNKACLFHFAQALFKHFTAPGFFKTEYNNDPKINSWFRRLFCLSLVPVDQITEVWIKILNDKPIFIETNKNKKIDEFLEYFVDTYFEGKFDINLWNHFDTEGPRTNNDIEGYNLKLKNHVSRAHLDIYKSFQVFQTQEHAAFVKYKHALDGKPAQPRKKLNIGRDNEIKIYKKLLKEGNINIDVYVNNLLPFFSFRKNKKKDKAADISDSSDEDGNVLSEVESESENEVEEVDEMGL